MPERLFRVTIRNPTQGLRLVKRGVEHLCHGVWTGEPALTPPPEIAAGATGWFQSESDGLMTGTEGWVKYDVVSGAGPEGMAYFYWDNPWFGVTFPNFLAVPAGAGYTAPCGDQAPTSAFKLEDKPSFSLKPVAYRDLDSARGDDITQVVGVPLFG
jgi:hypothetical protein